MTPKELRLLLPPLSLLLPPFHLPLLASNALASFDHNASLVLLPPLPHSLPPSHTSSLPLCLPYCLPLPLFLHLYLCIYPACLCLDQCDSHYLLIPSSLPASAYNLLLTPFHPHSLLLSLSFLASIPFSLSSACLPAAHVACSHLAIFQFSLVFSHVLLL